MRTIRIRSSKGACPPRGKGERKQLEDLQEEFNLKQRTLLRQAVHADPHLVERAAERIHSYIVRQRLDEHPSAIAAYQKGGMVAAEINAILAAEFCSELLAPVVQQYEDEQAQIQQQYASVADTPR